jgi:hypothetical protein
MALASVAGTPAPPQRNIVESVAGALYRSKHMQAAEGTSLARRQPTNEERMRAYVRFEHIFYKIDSNHSQTVDRFGARGPLPVAHARLSSV